jgi:hypothetical protein
MAVLPYVETVEELPAGLADHYTLDEGTGRYNLDVTPTNGYALEDVAGLKSTLGKLKERAVNAEGAAKPFSELNLSASEITAQLSELTSLRDAQGNETEVVSALKSSLESLKAQSLVEIDKAVAPINSKLDARTAQLKEITIVNELRKAITAAEGNPLLLIPALLGQVQARENDDGTISAVIVDAEGTERVMGAGLESMSFGDLVAEVKENPDYAQAFAASGASGGGTNSNVNNTNTRGKLTAEQAGKLSMPEYRKAVEENRI